VPEVLTVARHELGTSLLTRILLGIHVPSNAVGQARAGEVGLSPSPGDVSVVKTDKMLTAST
jgi:hypothetical protein